METLWKNFDEPVMAWVQGASRGIGLGMVETLLRDGQTNIVIATSRHPEQSERLMALKQEHPERLEVFGMDVTDEGSIIRAVEQVEEHAASLNLVINTAGVLHDQSMGLSPEKRLDDLDAEALDRAFRVNTIGAMLWIKHVHTFLPRQGRSVLASLSARVGSIGDNRLGGWYGYRMSKAALNQGMHTAAIEIGRKWKEAICVLLHPGTVDTGLSKPFQKNVPQGKLFEVEESVRHLFDVIDTLKVEDSGELFDWAGERIVW